MGTEKGGPLTASWSPIGLVPTAAEPVLWARRTQSGWDIDASPYVMLGHYLPSATTDRDDGVYLRWRVESGKAEIENDRYGMYPAFIFQKDDVVAVSPSLPALIARGAHTAFDYDALAVFLRMGQFVGDDTPFQYIKVLPPCCRIDLTDKGCRLRSRRDLGLFNARPTVEAAADRYAELFSAAMKRRLSTVTRFGIPLSGGRDSRHILFEAVRQGRRPEICVTVDEWPDDTQVARSVAAKTGCASIILESPTDLLNEEMRRNILANFLIDEGTWSLAVADFFRERPAYAVFDGIGGDMLSNGLLLTPERLQFFIERDTQTIADQILPDIEPILQKLLSKAFLRRVSREAATTRVAAEIQTHHVGNNPVTSFFFWNRTRRRISNVPFGLMRKIPIVLAPYLDHAVYDFLVSLAPDVILRQRFHDMTISRAYPEFADLGYENKQVTDYDRATVVATATRQFAQKVLTRRLPKPLARTSVNMRMLAALCGPRRAAASFAFARRLAYLLQLFELGAQGVTQQGSVFYPPMKLA